MPNPNRDADFQGVYRMEFAPDGLHFVVSGKAKLEKAWAWLTSRDCREHKALLPNAKVRIVNVRTGKVIGDE